MTPARGVAFCISAMMALMLPFLALAQQCGNEPKVNCVGPNGGMTVECGSCPQWRETVTPGTGQSPTPTTNKKSTGDKTSCDEVEFGGPGGFVCSKKGIIGNRSGTCTAKYPACTAEQLQSAAEIAADTDTGGLPGSQTGPAEVNLLKQAEQLANMHYETAPDGSAVYKPLEAGDLLRAYEQTPPAQQGLRNALQTEARKLLGSWFDNTTVTPEPGEGMANFMRNTGTQFYPNADGSYSLGPASNNAPSIQPNRPVTVGLSEIGQAQSGFVTPTSEVSRQSGTMLARAQEAAANAWQTVRDFSAAAWEKTMAALTPTDETLPGADLPDSPNMTPEQELPGIEVVQTPDVPVTGLPQNVTELAEMLDSSQVAEEVRSSYVNEILGSKEQGWAPSSDQYKEAIGIVESAPDDRGMFARTMDRFINYSDRAQTLARLNSGLQEASRAEALGILSSNASGLAANGQMAALPEFSDASVQELLKTTPEGARVSAASQRANDKALALQSTSANLKEIAGNAIDVRDQLRARVDQLAALEAMGVRDIPEGDVNSLLRETSDQLKTVNSNLERMLDGSDPAFEKQMYDAVQARAQVNEMFGFGTLLYKPIFGGEAGLRDLGLFISDPAAWREGVIANATAQVVTQSVDQANNWTLAGGFAGALPVAGVLGKTTGIAAAQQMGIGAVKVAGIGSVGNPLGSAFDGVSAAGRTLFGSGSNTGAGGAAAAARAADLDFNPAFADDLSGAESRFANAYTRSAREAVQAEVASGTVAPEAFERAVYNRLHNSMGKTDFVTSGNGRNVMNALESEMRARGIVPEAGFTPAPRPVVVPDAGSSAPLPNNRAISVSSRPASQSPFSTRPRAAAEIPPVAAGLPASGLSTPAAAFTSLPTRFSQALSNVGDAMQGAVQSVRRAAAPVALSVGMLTNPLPPIPVAGIDVPIVSSVAPAQGAPASQVTLPAKVEIDGIKGVETGAASTYNPAKPGWRTGGTKLATGARYNPKAYEAALQTDLAAKYQMGHGNYPRNGFALVEQGDKKLIVKINDNGPLVSGRIIDLNEASMRYLSNNKYGNNSGVLKDVKVTVLEGTNYTPGPVAGDASLVARADTAVPSQAAPTQVAETRPALTLVEQMQQIFDDVGEAVSNAGRQPAMSLDDAVSMKDRGMVQHAARMPREAPAPEKIVKRYEELAAQPETRIAPTSHPDAQNGSIRTTSLDALGDDFIRDLTSDATQSLARLKQSGVVKGSLGAADRQYIASFIDNDGRMYLFVRGSDNLIHQVVDNTSYLIAPTNKSMPNWRGAVYHDDSPARRIGKRMIPLTQSEQTLERLAGNVLKNRRYGPGSVHFGSEVTKTTIEDNKIAQVLSLNHTSRHISPSRLNVEYKKQGLDNTNLIGIEAACSVACPTITREGLIVQSAWGNALADMLDADQSSNAVAAVAQPDFVLVSHARLAWNRGLEGSEGLVRELATRAGNMIGRTVATLRSTVPDTPPNQFVETAFNRASPFNTLPEQTVEGLVRNFTTPSALDSISPLDVRPAPVLVSEPAPVARPTSPTQVAANEPVRVRESASESRGISPLDLIEVPIAIGNAPTWVASKIADAGSYIRTALVGPAVPENPSVVTNTPPTGQVIASNEPGVPVRTPENTEVLPSQTTGQVLEPVAPTALAESRPIAAARVPLTEGEAIKSVTPTSVALRPSNRLGDEVMQVSEQPVQIASKTVRVEDIDGTDATAVASADVKGALSGVEAAEAKAIAAKVFLAELDTSKRLADNVNRLMSAYFNQGKVLDPQSLSSAIQKSVAQVNRFERALVDAEAAGALDATTAAQVRELFTPVKNTSQLLDAQRPQLMRLVPNSHGKVSLGATFGVDGAAEGLQAIRTTPARLSASLAERQALETAARIGAEKTIAAADIALAEAKRIAEAEKLRLVEQERKVEARAAQIVNQQGPVAYVPSATPGTWTSADALTAPKGPFEVSIARLSETPSTPQSPVDLPSQDPGVPSGRTPTIARNEEIDPALNPPPIPRQDPELPFPENTGAIPEGEISPTLTTDGGPIVTPPTQTLSPYGRLRSWVNDRLAEYRTNRLAAGTGPTQELAPMTDSFAQRLAASKTPDVSRAEHVAELNGIVDALQARRDVAIRNAAEIRAAMTDPQVPLPESPQDALLARAADEMDEAAQAFDESLQHAIRSREAYARNTPEGDAESIESAGAVERAFTEKAVPLESRSLATVRAAELPAADDMIGQLNAWKLAHGDGSDTGGTGGGAGNGGSGGGANDAGNAAGNNRWTAVLKSVGAWCMQGGWRSSTCLVLGLSGAGIGIDGYQRMTATLEETTPSGNPTDIPGTIVTAPDVTKAPGTDAPAETKPDSSTSTDQPGPAVPPGNDDQTGAGAPRGDGGDRGGVARDSGTGSGGGFMGGGMNLLSGLFQGLMQWLGGGEEAEDQTRSQQPAPAQPEPPVGAIVGNPSLIDAGTNTTLSWSTVGTDVSSSTCAIITSDFAVFARGGPNGSIASPELSESTRFGLVCNVRSAQDKLLNETLVRVRGDDTDPPRIFTDEQIAASQASSGNPVRPTQGSNTQSGSNSGGSSGSPAPQDVRTCDPEQPMDSFIRCLCEAEPNPRGCSVPPGGLRQ